MSFAAPRAGVTFSKGILDIANALIGLSHGAQPGLRLGEVRMGSRITSGIVGGLLAGVVFGMMMQMMTAPTPDGTQMPMINHVAMIVGSTSTGIGWLYHLLNSSVIGAIFGGLFGRRLYGYGSAFGWGAAYGFTWWILGGLILMPLFLGMPAFAPLLMPPMRMVAMGSLVGHLVYGLILGGAYVALIRRMPVTAHA